MKIVKPYMRMLTTGYADLGINGYGYSFTGQQASPLSFVNFCGRISHRSEDAEKQDIERFLRSIVIDHGDWSITEHVSVSVDAVVDRGITHEIVRHRIGAYTQESTRFVNYNKEKDGKVVRPPSFIYPIPGVECEWCLTDFEVEYRQDSKKWEHYIDHLHERKDCAYNPQWLFGIRACEEAYIQLTTSPKDSASGFGWRPQEARSVFPNALSNRIVITYNLRMWRHFFLMRTTAEAHPQMRQVTIPLLEEFKRAIPVLYDDIEPNSKQSENLKKAR